jgi:hypothetical protein
MNLPPTPTHPRGTTHTHIKADMTPSNLQSQSATPKPFRFTAADQPGMQRLYAGELPFLAYHAGILQLN